MHAVDMLQLRLLQTLWLNHAVTTLWPFYNKAVAKLVLEQAKPQIDEAIKPVSLCLYIPDCEFFFLRTRTAATGQCSIACVLAACSCVQPGQLSAGTHHLIWGDCKTRPALPAAPLCLDGHSQCCRVCSTLSMSCSQSCHGWLPRAQHPCSSCALKGVTLPALTCHEQPPGEVRRFRPPSTGPHTRGAQLPCGMIEHGKITALPAALYEAGSSGRLSVALTPEPPSCCCAGVSLRHWYLVCSTPSLKPSPLTSWTLAPSPCL